jgi:hypothetical protein
MQALSLLNVGTPYPNWGCQPPADISAVQKTTVRVKLTI